MSLPRITFLVSAAALAGATLLPWMNSLLAKSERVQPSIIGYAYRYWMGRDEMLIDSPRLIAADQSFLKRDGCFCKVLVSLLTSGSFLDQKYRRQ